jgi:hypothetical protein
MWSNIAFIAFLSLGESSFIPRGVHVIDNAKPSGYDGRFSQASKNIKWTVGTHGYANPCVHTMVLMFFQA